MPRDNGFDGTYMRREKQKKEKAVKTSKTTSEKVCWLTDSGPRLWSALLLLV